MVWKQCTMCQELVVSRNTRNHLIDHTAAFGDVELDIVEGMFEDADTSVTGDDLLAWQAEASERIGLRITAMALSDHVRFFADYRGDDLWADIPRAIMANKPQRGLDEATELFQQMIERRTPRSTQ